MHNVNGVSWSVCFSILLVVLSPGVKAVCTSAQELCFDDIKLSTIMTQQSIMGNGKGVSLADFDEDGDLDIYIVMMDSANVLLINDGDGAFREAAEIYNVADEGPGKSAVWLDYDDDGFLDLFVVNEGAENLLFHGIAGKWFENVTDSAIDKNGVAIFSGHAATVFDYDLDGDLDIYVINRAGANVLYKHQDNVDAGQKYFVAYEDNTQTQLIDPQNMNYEQRGVAVADTDLDGTLDVVTVAHSSNAALSLRLFGGLGSGQYVYYDNQVNQMQMSRGRSLAFADVNKDRYPDLYVGRNYQQLDRLFVSSLAVGDWILQSNAVSFQESSSSMGLAFGDYNCDGDIDLVVASIDDNGDTFLENVGLNNDPAYQLVATDVDGLGSTRPTLGVVAGDLDGDGDLDLVISETETEQSSSVIDHHIQINAINPTEGTWLVVSLLANALGGGRHRKLFYGAAVDLYEVDAAVGPLSTLPHADSDLASSVTYRQTRFVDGGSGDLSQPPYELHFGGLIRDKSRVLKVSHGPTGTSVLVNLPPLGYCPQGQFPSGTRARNNVRDIIIDQGPSGATGRDRLEVLRYRDEIEMAPACSPCPAGTTTSAFWANDIADCDMCLPDYYAAPIYLDVFDESEENCLEWRGEVQLLCGNRIYVIGPDSCGNLRGTFYDCTGAQTLKVLFRHTTYSRDRDISFKLSIYGQQLLHVEEGEWTTNINEPAVRILDLQDTWSSKCTNECPFLSPVLNNGQYQCSDGSICTEESDKLFGLSDENEVNSGSGRRRSKSLRRKRGVGGLDDLSRSSADEKSNHDSCCEDKTMGGYTIRCPRDRPFMCERQHCRGNDFCCEATAEACEESIEDSEHPNETKEGLRVCTAMSTSSSQSSSSTATISSSPSESTSQSISISLSASLTNEVSPSASSSTSASASASVSSSTSPSPALEEEEEESASEMASAVTGAAAATVVVATIVTTSTAASATSASAAAATATVTATATTAASSSTATAAAASTSTSAASAAAGTSTTSAATASGASTTTTTASASSTSAGGGGAGVQADTSVQCTSASLDTFQFVSSVGMVDAELPTSAVLFSEGFSWATLEVDIGVGGDEGRGASPTDSAKTVTMRLAQKAVRAFFSLLDESTDGLKRGDDQGEEDRRGRSTGHSINEEAKKGRLEEHDPDTLVIQCGMIFALLVALAMVACGLLVMRKRRSGLKNTTSRVTLPIMLRLFSFGYFAVTVAVLNQLFEGGEDGWARTIAYVLLCAVTIGYPAFHVAILVYRHHMANFRKRRSRQLTAARDKQRLDEIFSPLVRDFRPKMHVFGLAGTMRKLGTAIALVATKSLPQAWILLAVNGLYLLCLFRNPYALRLVWPVDICATTMRVALSVLIVYVGYSGESRGDDEVLGWVIVGLEATAVIGLLFLQIALARPAFHRLASAVGERLVGSSRSGFSGSRLLRSMSSFSVGSTSTRQGRKRIQARRKWSNARKEGHKWRDVDNDDVPPVSSAPPGLPPPTVFHNPMFKGRRHGSFGKNKEHHQLQSIDFEFDEL